MWSLAALMMLPAVFTSSGKSTPSGLRGTGLAELAEPAGFTVGGIQYGIASKHVRDQGLKSDPDVIFAEDFEVAEVKDLEKRGWVPRWGPGLWANGRGEKRGWKYYEITAEPGVAFTGKRCLKKSITPEVV